jgi:small-conductance mechanosensitive channel
MNPLASEAIAALAEPLRASGTPYAIALMAVVGALAWWLRPQDRSVTRNTVAFFLIGVAGQMAAAGLVAGGLEGTGAVLHEVFVIATGVAVIRLAGLFFFRVILSAIGFAPPRILEDLLVMIGYIAWGMVRLRYAGLDLSGIVTTSAVITAVVAFAAQDTLSNLLGGIALEIDSSLSIGDWIRIDDVTGRVVDIRWRSTSIETRNGETVVVPNAHLVRGKFAILGRLAADGKLLRRWVWFNVDLAAPPGRVIEAVKAGLSGASIPGVAGRPEPDCVLMDFERGYGRYAVRYWLSDIARDDPTDSLVREHVLTALQRQRLRIAVPEHSLHLTQEDAEHREEVRQRDLARRLKALRGVELFAVLDDAERRHVAERLVHSPFSRGDTITREGAVAHWLYIVSSGEADVVKVRADGRSEHLATLGAGTFFGEMALLTGEPRRATVVARTDVDCYRLDKQSLDAVVRARPAIAEALSRVLALREADLSGKLLAAEDRDAGSGAESLRVELLRRIRDFFGIADSTPDGGTGR